MIRPRWAVRRDIERWHLFTPRWEIIWWPRSALTPRRCNARRRWFGSYVIAGRIR